MKSILFICTGNTCRSQMAEGWARSLGWEAFSAGVEPSGEVNPYAVRAMAEAGIDISTQLPKDLSQYLSQNLDVIVTLCDHANETCPVFAGKYQLKIHQGFTDPYGASGTDVEIMQVYRQSRDDIHAWLIAFSAEQLTP